MNIQKLFFYVLLLIFIPLAQVPAVLAQPAVPEATDGSELFIQYRCSRCHTIGRGVFVGPDLKGVGDRYSEEEIIRWIENPQLIYGETGKMPVNPGFPPMPPMQVPPEAAKAIADYVLAAEPDSDAQKGGEISGRVVSGMDNAPKPGVRVIVTPFMGDNPSGEPKTIISGEDGAFSFTGLSWNRSYALSINYKGAEYATGNMVFNPGEDKKSLELPVFEPTLSDENIRINEAQVIVQVLEGNVAVADISVFENTGDTIYIGGEEVEGGDKKESVRYSLPKGAFDVSFIHGLDPESVVTTDIGFSDTTSILPGPRRAVFTYTVPLGSGEALVDKKILYPTSRLLLLVLETGNDFTVKGLTEEEPVVINNERFLKWTGEGLEAGSEVVIEIGSSSSALEGQYTTWAAMGVLAIIVIAGVLYAAFRKKEPSPKEAEEESQGEPETGLEDRRSSLIKEIAEIDDRKEAGQIAEAEYKTLRDKKKEELLEVTRRLRATHKSP